MKITVPNSVWAEITSAQDAKALSRCLSYKAQFARRSGFSTKIQEYQKSVILSDGRFPAGLIPRVIEWGAARDIPIDVIYGQMAKGTYPVNFPSINGIVLREDQNRTILESARIGRGYIQYPTGSGKTVIAAGLISCYPKEIRALFLCHTVTLLEQTKKDFAKFFDEPIGVIGGGTTDIQRITVATIQSYSRLVNAEWRDLVIVDECHHISGFSTEYAKVLSLFPAPLRFGLTATPPTKEEGIMALEGFIGPKIAELTMEEALDRGILAKPKIHILKAPMHRATHELRRYPEVYESGIVTNQERHRLIMGYAKEQNKQGKSVLILVTKLDHIHRLLEMAWAMGVNALSVDGSTDGEVREKMRQLLNEKKAMCYISSRVWREGVNIPSLDVIINAAGEKSEIPTLQALGRGLRRTKDKAEVTLVDIFDPSHTYLINHFGHRISLYCSEGWL